MEPVKKTEAPGYYQVIRFPMGMFTCLQFISDKGADDLKWNTLTNRQTELYTVMNDKITTEWWHIAEEVQGHSIREGVKPIY